MKKVTSTLTTLLLCLYVSAQVGTLDGGFNTTGYAIQNFFATNQEYGSAIGTHSDGRVVVAAKSDDKTFTIVRYLTDGTLDPAFGTGGIVQLEEASGADAFPYALAVTSDNKIFVVGSSWVSSIDFGVLKLLENGTPDVSFGGDGWASIPVGSFRDIARGIAIQPDGKILVAGDAETASNSGIYNFAVARFNANGTLDNTGFGTNGIVNIDINGDDRVSGVVLQSDGKIIVGGSSNYSSTNSDYTAVRLNTDGTIDNTTYGVNGIASIDIEGFGAPGSNDWANAIAIQPDGKVILTGQTHTVGIANGHIATVRLTTAGALDPTWNPTGAIVNPFAGVTNTAPGIAVFNVGVINNDEGTRSIGIQSDGKIIVGGDGDGESPSFDFLLIRYNSNGTPDNTFSLDGLATADLGGTDEIGYAIKLFGNRIYIAGTTIVGGQEDFAIAAFENDGSPLPVVLSQFYAQKQTSKVVLQWQTSSEENVKQFVIERSNDGKTYKAIGTVAAAGNSTLTKNYSFADQSPFTSANNYYRLLMQDVDGNYKYSKILIIKFDGQLTTNMQVFPSNVKDILQVQLPNGLNGNVSLQVIDMNGRVVKRNNLASDGSALNTTVDVSNLTKGAYILKAQAGNTSVISRFTKQ
ncbi:T9SS type A sorting domain-containing protein [Niastella caeni]|nr:T9SS type A sorting domain-containing protein [Niastella caeni]